MGRLTTFFSAVVACALLVNSTKAEEAAEPLLNALASTTISGYLDVSGHWDPGTGRFTAMTPSGPIVFEISPYEAELMYLAALADREEFIKGLLELKAKNPFVEFTPENFDRMLLINPPDLPEVVPVVANPKLLPYLPEWWLIYKSQLSPLRQIPTRTLRLSPTPILTPTSTVPAIRTYLTNVLSTSSTTLHSIDWQFVTNHLIDLHPIPTNLVVTPIIPTNGGVEIGVTNLPPTPEVINPPEIIGSVSGSSFSGIRISLDSREDRQSDFPMPPWPDRFQEGVRRDTLPEPTNP